MSSMQLFSLHYQLFQSKYSDKILEGIWMQSEYETWQFDISAISEAVLTLCSYWPVLLIFPLETLYLSECDQ